MWDGDQIALELDGSGTVVNKYLRGINLIYAENSAGTRSYYLFNGHGDVVQLTNTAGDVSKNYDYDAFGNEKNPDSADTNVFRYCGEYFDKETGTIYLRARYYDPEIGRFISEDSYWGKDADPLSLNLYTYCQDDPINNTDPSGHWIVDVLFTVYDTYQFIKDPSLENAAWLLADIASFADPTGAASTAAHAAKAVNTAVKAVKVAEKGVKLVHEASEVKKALKVGEEVGHLVESVAKGAKNPVVKKAIEAGKEAHKLKEYGKGVAKEVRLPSGKRMDGYDAANKVIHELKPNNLKAIKKGLKQIDRYIEEANKVYGPGHTGKLHTY